MIRLALLLALTATAAAEPVALTGNHAFSTATLRAQLVDAPPTDHRGILTHYYDDRGYLFVDIDDALAIHEGPLCVYGNVTVVDLHPAHDAVGDPSQLQAYVKTLGPGAPILRVPLQAAMAELERRFDLAGYGAALAIPLFTTRPDGKTMDLRIEIDRQAIHTIGAIDAKGGDATAITRARDALGMRLGQTFRRADLAAARARVVAFFSDAIVSYEYLQPDPRIRVTVDLKLDLARSR